MVQLMLAGFGGDCRSAAEKVASEGKSFDIDCYHVNARLSQKLEDIGDLRIGKFILLIGYCAQAIWCRFRHGVTNFYYIPAPGKRSVPLNEHARKTTAREPRRLRVRPPGQGRRLGARPLRGSD